MKKNITRILFGVVCLLAAVVTVGNLANWWNLTFEGWWAFFIIIPGIASIISTGIDLGNGLFTLFGLMILAKKQGLFDAIPGEAVAVVVLVLIGLYLIFKPNISFSHEGKIQVNKNRNRNRNKNSNSSYESVNASSDDFPQLTAAFTKNKTCFNNILRGGNLTAVFGNLIFSLDNAVVQDGAVVEAVSVFGSIEIITNGKCRVIPQGTSIFGSVNDMSSGQHNDNLPVMYLNHKTVFGSIDIK